MQAYGRAANPDQPFAVWRESLNQANRLSRTFAAMHEALNRHRGKGSQQKVTVEHVTVNEGGQAGPKTRVDCRRSARPGAANGTTCS